MLESILMKAEPKVQMLSDKAEGIDSSPGA